MAASFCDSFIPGNMLLCVIPLSLLCNAVFQATALTVVNKSFHSTGKCFPGACDNKHSKLNLGHLLFARPLNFWN